MKNSKHTEQDFCLWVDKYRNKYLDLILKTNGEATEQEIDELLKNFKRKDINDYNYLKHLDIDNFIFASSFNKYLLGNPEIEELVCVEILRQEHVENLHLLTAFLGQSETIDHMEYNSVNEMIKHLCNRVMQEVGYCFELSYLKVIQKKYDAFVEECFAMVREYGFVEEYVEAKQVQKMLKSAISNSTLKKADYLGWKIVK